MSKNNTAEIEPRDVFTTVDYRYEVYTESKDGIQLDGEHATRIGLAKNRAMLMLGQNNDGDRAFIHDRMARWGRPKLWRFDGVHWEVAETRVPPGLD